MQGLSVPFLNLGSISKLSVLALLSLVYISELLYTIKTSTYSVLLTGKVKIPQKGDFMRRLALMFSILALALVLGGCATKTGNGMEGQKTKCPACGFEFNVPSDA
jgi:predicted small secreted protein